MINQNDKFNIKNQIRENTLSSTETGKRVGAACLVSTVKGTGMLALTWGFTPSPLQIY